MDFPANHTRPTCEDISRACRLYEVAGSMGVHAAFLKELTLPQRRMLVLMAHAAETAESRVIHG